MNEPCGLHVRPVHRRSASHRQPQRLQPQPRQTGLSNVSPLKKAFERPILPSFASAAQQLPEVRYVKVDSDAAPAARAHYSIRSIPTLILFKGGLEVARVSGAVPTARLVLWVQQHLRSGAA